MSIRLCRQGPPDPDWFHPADKRCTACTGWRALRMDEQLLRRSFHPRGEAPVAGEIKADLRTVNHIVTQAIRQLRQLVGGYRGWRKNLRGKTLSYELPYGGRSRRCIKPRPLPLNTDGSPAGGANGADSS